MHPFLSILFLLIFSISSAKISEDTTFGCHMLAPFPDDCLPWIDNENTTQVPIPMVSLNVHTKITANVASSSMKFKYENPSKNQSINVNFKFPIDVDTAVYKVLVTYENGEMFEARIEEKEAAKKEFNEAKDAGHKATLVETEKGQDDILIMNLANIPAGSSAEIELCGRVGNLKKIKLKVDFFHSNFEN